MTPKTLARVAPPLGFPQVPGDIFRGSAESGRSTMKRRLERARLAFDGSKAKQLLKALPDLNREVWLAASLLLTSAILNFVVASNTMVLGFYALPTIFSAYAHGRRHATLTALASTLVVALSLKIRPDLFAGNSGLESTTEAWLHIGVWGGILILTGYAMGTLYDHKQAQVRELRDTYNGVLMILQHLISKDKYTQNHSYRVSVYAVNIAIEMGVGEGCVEDVRTASLLHDIGKLDTSRKVLYKAARLNDEEFQEMKLHVEKGIGLLSPVGGSLRRILPIILTHHDKFDGTGYHPTQDEDIPLEARIISVADVYDALTSDRPYRKAMPIFEAKQMIVEMAGSDFDPVVVDAFVTVFNRGEMEIPEVMV